MNFKLHAANRAAAMAYDKAVLEGASDSTLQALREVVYATWWDAKTEVVEGFLHYTPGPFGVYFSSAEEEIITRNSPSKEGLVYVGGDKNWRDWIPASDN